MDAQLILQLAHAIIPHLTPCSNSVRLQSQTAKSSLQPPHLGQELNQHPSPAQRLPKYYGTCHTEQHAQHSTQGTEFAPFYILLFFRIVHGYFFDSPRAFSQSEEEEK